MIDGNTVRVEFADEGLGSFADKLDGLRAREALNDSDFNTEFSGDSMDVPSPMANLAAAVSALFSKPEQSTQPVADQAIAPQTHVLATAVAMQINDQKGNIVGQDWKPSVEAAPDKFFKGLGPEQEKTIDKFEETGKAVETLAGVHQGLTGAIADIREQKQADKSGPQGSALATPAAGNNGKPTVGSIATNAAANAAIGSAAVSVAGMFAPAFAPIMATASSVHTLMSAATQSAALAFGQGNSDQYKVAKTKAEVLEFRDPSKSSPSSNNYANYFSQPNAVAGMIAPRNTSKGAFAQAVNEPVFQPEDPRDQQIAILEEAEAKVFKEGERQTAHMENAEMAAATHEKHIELAGAKFDVKELLRAADNGAMNDVQKTALIVAAQVESPEKAEKIEQKFGLWDPDLSLGHVVSTPMSTGPSTSGMRLG